ncbi:MAG: SprT family zinc-dependent metalloprotease [Candidatus Woesearchaeota archaeon]
MREEKLHANGREHQLKIFYDNRDNTRASITKNGVTIRIPRSMERVEQHKQIMKMKQWAVEKLEQSPELYRRKQRAYSNGETLRINDEEFLLKIMSSDKASSSARLNKNTIWLNISSRLNEKQKDDHISSLVSRCIAGKMLPRVREKVMQLNQKHFNFEVSKVFLKNHKSKWGSCSSKGNINLSTRLLLAPEDVLEYLIIHELAHLKHLNHSRDFWQLVEKAMPDYRDKEKWLKKNGSSLLI